MAFGRSSSSLVIFVIAYSQLIQLFHHPMVCHGYLGPSFMLHQPSKWDTLKAPSFQGFEDDHSDFNGIIPNRAIPKNEQVKCDTYNLLCMHNLNLVIFSVNS